MTDTSATPIGMAAGTSLWSDLAAHYRRCWSTKDYIDRHLIERLPFRRRLLVTICLHLMPDRGKPAYPVDQVLAELRRRRTDLA